MLTSTFLVSTNKRLRAYLIGGLIALMVVAGSLAYEVKPGDTLSGIAAKHGVSVKTLLENNDIANPDLILPGQKIDIPGSGDGGGGGGANVHVVASGETLGVIANRYKATVAAIAKANNLDNPNLIRVGQKLTIPSGGGSGGSSASGFHIVKSGETLGSIAKKYGLSVSALAEANGITNPNLIFIGTRLSLSGKSFVPENLPGEGGGGSSTTSHTVASGETLDIIARKYGTTANAIAKANSLKNPNLIRVGQVLSIPGAAWVCPVKGGTFVNDWGVGKPDGRWHQGIDIFAPRGTEVQAPVSGKIELVTGTIGGLQFYLYGDDGVTYIGTHLEAFGRSGRVQAGHVIGYVGDTGNARGGPTHLHFEMHPGDGDPVNPYPTLKEAGC
ncbi:MAG TPA: LysM peptidoglycan-binding domain-containing protein [Acidimicrobiia bacterium]|nr:LysM peptidoglycan-binding domain-containing protein [Acidimicrobiia bacterium]